MKKIILSALMLTGVLTFAQDGKLTVSGSVDVYGTTNLGDGESGVPGLLIDDPLVGGAESFGIGMANTVFSYEMEKSGMVADLAFGPRAADAAGFMDIVNQLYAYYNVNDKLTLTAGQFNTFLGYEVISPVANFNYTVSYLFNEGPFSHIGVKADYAASEDLSLMLAVTNPHGDFGNGVGNGDLQVGGQIGYKGQFLNLIYGNDGSGADDAFYIDYTGGFDLSETFYLGINAAYAETEDSGADKTYSGVALYLQNAFSDAFSLGLRPELFKREVGNADQEVFALTLTGNYMLTENLKFTTEVRYDSSDDQAIEATTEDNTLTATMAAIYSF
ncbi:outer membrane beta-barrel protein [Wenyingzhuangia sp. IMCC45533]